MNFYDILLAKKLSGGGGGDITTEALNVTANGQYTAPQGKAYTPVNVDIKGYKVGEVDVPTDIASFTASDAPLKSLNVSIEPVQDLHGYDSPWVGGAGKNKLPLMLDDIKSLNISGTWSGNAYTHNGCTFTILVDDSNNVTGFKVTGTASADITFVLYGNVQNVIVPGTSVTMNGCPANGSSSTYRMYAYTVGYDYGSGVTGNVPSTQCACGIMVFSGCAFPSDGLTFYPMIRLATETDPTFAPYSNICPISGWTEEVITVADDLQNPTVTHTTTIPFTDSQGNPVEVYGGSVDVVNGGEQPRTLGSVDLGTLRWIKNSGRFEAQLPDNSQIYVYNSDLSDLMSEMWTPKVRDAGWNNMTDGQYGIAERQLRIKYSSVETTEEFATLVNGSIFLYPLATPTTFYTQPTSIKSLDGENIVSASTGQIEDLEYFEEL